MPTYVDAQKNLGMAELKQGNFSSGFINYEARFLMPNGSDTLEVIPKCPRWDGDLVPDGTPLLLVCEQGLGDTLQFMRYAIPLRELGFVVRICAPQKLHSLIQVSGIDPSPLLAEQAALITDGVWCPLLSVPQLLGVTPQNPLITSPYIKTSVELVDKWHVALKEEMRPLIGLHWQGNPAHEKTNNYGRSLPLESFGPLAAQTKGTLISLQKGHGVEQLDACTFKSRFVHCQDQITEALDFLETSAIVANCDVVVTSDTSLAHLAAGMGQKVCLLLKKHAEWRWLINEDSSFWYPSVKLFRQFERGCWDDVILRVIHDLGE